MAKFHCNLSDESDQFDRTTAKHLRILFQFLLTKGVIPNIDNHVGSHGWLHKSVSL